MKLIGLATGERTAIDGNYVLAYSPDGHDGLGRLEVTSRLALAKRYDSGKDALEEWQRVSATHPVRPDGKPNRPLTGFTVEIVPL